VFMEYNRDAEGNDEPLPRPSIDTGAGLERILPVLQGVDSIFATDAFLPMIEASSSITGRAYGRDEKTDVGLRIMADHGRAMAMLVTDGVLRDRAGVLASGLPVWCAGMAAPASVNGLTFVGWNEPVGCGGVAIFPDDFIVVDDDGAVVIPKDLIEFVAHEGAEHELYESWVFTEVEKGVQLPGLYPPNEEAKARYQEWRHSLD